MSAIFALRNDQYAFRPTGSTSAAIIAILQSITDLLYSNQYVIVLALNFSKAFDTIRQDTLLNKMAFLDIPGAVYNWLVDFFTDHSHCTRYRGTTSAMLDISASIIQGQPSVLCPMSSMQLTLVT